MKYYNKIVNREILITDYVPLEIDNDYSATDYYFFKAKRFFLELAYDCENSIIYRITFLLCDKYQKISQLYSIPENHKKGDVLIKELGEKKLLIIVAISIQMLLKLLFQMMFLVNALCQKTLYGNYLLKAN